MIHPDIMDCSICSHKQDTEMGILSRAKLSIYPAISPSTGPYLALTSASGCPSILVTLSTPFLAWEPRSCCAQPAFLHLPHTQTTSQGPRVVPTLTNSPLLCCLLLPCVFGHAHLGVPGCSLVAAAFLPRSFPLFYLCRFDSEC